jgi:hypothetical protein
VCDRIDRESGEDGGMNRARLLVPFTLVLLVVVAGAFADSTPIGTLPDGPTTSVSTQRGQLVAVALPAQKASTGLVWRVARTVDPKVLRQVSEADVGSSVVVVFRATGAGTAKVAFALTRGDASPKAVKAATWVVRVR